MKVFGGKRPMRTKNEIQFTKKFSNITSYLSTLSQSKADIIALLQKDILPFQGLKAGLKDNALDNKIGAIRDAFANASFPIGAIHEFIFSTLEESAATTGFVSSLLGPLMHSEAVLLWISPIQNIFSPALQSFGITPDRVIFIHPKKDKDILWAMEEGLKCPGIAAVIGDMQELSFTNSRRLQLAVEQSHVTGFVFRRNPRNLNTTACVSRWKISSLPSELEDGMPGVGFPRWKVDLLKVRNGKPCTWHIECVAGTFRHISRVTALSLEQHRKTG